MLVPQRAPFNPPQTTGIGAILDSAEAAVRKGIPSGSTLADLARHLRSTWTGYLEAVAADPAADVVRTDLMATNEGILHLRGLHESIVRGLGTSDLCDRLADLVDPEPGDAFEEVVA